MEINLTEIYKGLDEWRAERGITAESQKAGYIINIMEELSELASALRDYEKFSATEQDAAKKQKAEYEIIDALCDISVFTINAGADIPCEYKISGIENSIFQTYKTYKTLLNACGGYSIGFNAYAFNGVLRICAVLCYKLGFNFEIAMLETIKEISSRTGAYDEKAKKWVKDESDEAKAKWYQADYEKARIKAMIKFFENGNKELLKRVLEEVYNCQNVEQLSDDELVFCFIAKTLKSLESFCELFKSAETELESRIIELDERLKKLEKVVVYHNERLSNELSE